MEAPFTDSDFFYASLNVNDFTTKWFAMLDDKKKMKEEWSMDVLENVCQMKINSKLTWIFN